MIANRWSALIPETVFKRYYFFRNRGYLARRHRRLASFVMDCLAYPYIFVIKRKGDWAGLGEWGRAFWHGLCYRFTDVPDVTRNSER